MPTPSELVTDAFAQAQSYASTAQGQLSTYLQSLADAVTITPLVNVSFTPVAEPGAAAAPIYMPPGDYSSTLTTTLRDAITARLAGGTGLDAAVEEAIWDRARERELTLAQAAIDQVTADSEALGWLLPPGVLVDSIRRETRGYYDKVSTLSRDIAIEQAKLEQANLLKAFDQAAQFEAILADVIVKRIEPGLRAYTADVERYRAEIEQDVKHWEASWRQYEATTNYTMNGQKLNAEIIRANNSALLEAGKVGAQVYAQLTASAYSMIHASAGVSAGASNSVSYSYSNDTSSAPPSVTAV